MATHTQTAAIPGGSVSSNRPKRGFMSRLAYHFERYWQLWILVAPGLIFMFLFAYVPMWGIQLAFREFEPSKGLTGGQWVGFKYFIQFFQSPLFGQIMWNTVRISLWTLIMGFIFPIILALLINQIGSKKVKGFVQTVTYMPHFISMEPDGRPERHHRGLLDLRGLAALRLELHHLPGRPVRRGHLAV